MTAPERQQVCTFKIDRFLFGIDVADVQEVIRHQYMTPVPLAPASVVGLINLRGQIVTAVDMRHKLGLARYDALSTNIVVRHANGIVSLLVDDVGDVLEVDDAQYEALPPTLELPIKALVRGIYKLSSELLLVLDTPRAASAAVSTQKRENP